MKNAEKRARKVREAIGEIAEGETLAVPTRHGEVHIDRADIHASGDVSYVDIYLAGPIEGGHPHYRLINPPLLVEDPAGDIVSNGVCYREDPLLAIATVIASLGGARVQKGRRR